MQRVKWSITLFFLAIGLVTLTAYIKLGVEHASHVGERYQLASVRHPASSQQRIISQENIAESQSSTNQLMTTEEIR